MTFKIGFAAFEEKEEKAADWFKAPPKPEDEYVSGSDDTSFPLRELSEMHIEPEKAERGGAYYAENCVRYLCLDGTKGYAIVEGTSAYDVEFAYSDGMVSAMTCSCYCTGACKHEYAAMLQLRETLECIEKSYADEYRTRRYPPWVLMSFFRMASSVTVNSVLL